MSRIEDSHVQWSATDPMRKFQADYELNRLTMMATWCRPDEGLGNPGCFGPRATLLGRVTLTYFLKVAQVPRVIDRPIPRVLQIDALPTPAGNGEPNEH